MAGRLSQKYIGVHARTATGAIPAAGENPITLTWSLSSYVRRSVHKKEIVAKFREDHLIGTIVADTVFPLTFTCDGAQKAVVSKDTGSTFSSPKSIKTALTSFGCRDSYGKDLIPKLSNVAKIHNLMDLSYLFMAGCTAMIDLQIAQDFATYNARPVVTARAAQPMERNIFWSQWGDPEGQHVPLAKRDLWLSEGATHLYIEDETEFGFLIIIDQLRGNQPVNRFTNVYARDRFTRKSSNIVFKPVDFWLSFPTGLAGEAAYTRLMNKFRDSVVENPGVIFDGMLSIAARTGTLDQLDSALAKALAATAGTLVALQHDNNPAAAKYAMCTAVLEFGTLHEAQVAFPPVLYEKDDIKSAASGASLLEKTAMADADADGGATKPDQTPTLGAVSEKAMFDSLREAAALFHGHKTNSVPTSHAVLGLGSLTYAVTSMVANSVGLSWYHLRSTLGEMGDAWGDPLTDQFLKTEVGANEQKSYFQKSVCASLASLANISWSAKSMRRPQASIEAEVPPAIRTRLGPADGMQFGGLTHLRWDKPSN